MDVIDVIVPVHSGFAATKRCLDSVLAAGSAAPRAVIVIDDATPEPEIARLLDDLATGERITLLRNDANLGFVQSVKRGRARPARRDRGLHHGETAHAADWRG